MSLVKPMSKVLLVDAQENGELPRNNVFVDACM